MCVCVCDMCAHLCVCDMSTYMRYNQSLYMWVLPQCLSRVQSSELEGHDDADSLEKGNVDYDSMESLI